MNDFSEIEGELKKLRAAPLRAELTLRVENALAHEASAAPGAGVLPRRRSARVNWLSLGLGAGLAAAAAVMMMARVGDDQSSLRPKTVATGSATPIRSHPQSAGRFLPAGLTEVVYQTSDEGLQFQEGANRPMRRMRYQTRETLHWRNPETGASLRVSYPSEEVVLTPISGQ